MHGAPGVGGVPQGYVAGCPSACRRQHCPVCCVVDCEDSPRREVRARWRHRPQPHRAIGIRRDEGVARWQERRSGNGGGVLEHGDGRPVRGGPLPQRVVRAPCDEAATVGGEGDRVHPARKTYERAARWSDVPRCCHREDAHDVVFAPCDQGPAVRAEGERRQLGGTGPADGTRPVLAGAPDQQGAIGAGGSEEPPVCAVAHGL